MGAKLPNPNVAPPYFTGSMEEGANRGASAPGSDPRFGLAKQGKVSNAALSNRAGNPSVTTPRGGGFGGRRNSSRGR